ncbi:MAG TPA: hypothetical protein VIR58_17150 [Acidimicrobiales bacterium]
MGLLSERSEEDDEQGDVALSGLEDLDADRPDEMVYELDDWSERDRTVLKERLEALAVPHHWEEETTLVVAADDEAWVERILDQVEDDLSTALDEDVEQVAYDLSQWDEDNLAVLVDGLVDEAIPHGFEGAELLVHQIDEERVDEIIEALVSPGSASADDSPAGSAPADLMGPLFVAADRLSRDPGDREGTTELVAAMKAAEGSSAPYGMDKLWWDGVQVQAAELVALIDGHDPDPESIAARASTLREGLRPYV